MDVSRVGLLHLMQRNALDAGVRIRFETRVAAPPLLEDHDLVVGPTA